MLDRFNDRTSRLSEKVLVSKTGLQKIPTDECTSKGQECLMNVRSLLVPHPQTPKLTEPGEGSFYYPPPSAQSTAVFGVSLGEPRPDPTNSQALPDCLRVITTVADHAIRAMAWPSSFSLKERNGINKCERLLRIVTIGPGELNGQWNSVPVADQMTLAAELSPIGGIWTGEMPPKTARTEQLSTTARDQSI